MPFFHRFSAKLNHNKKYREVRKEQNRLALLREKQAQNRKELDQKHLERKVRERKRKNSSESKDEPKKKLTEKEQKQKIAEDEATLRGDEDQGMNFKYHLQRENKNHSVAEEIWQKPAQVEEDKTKEQEFDEYFQDLFL